MKQPTDQKLIQKTLEGDQEAFAALMARHGPSLFTRILRKVRYATDAEDLLQKVLVTVYTQLGQLRDQGRFRAWLTVIADNQVRMWQRRRWMQLKWEDRLDAEGNMVFQACDEPLEQQELTTALRAALACLSQAYREVIVHHYYKGYSYLETAELLGLQVNTVRNRLQKGRKRLHKEIAIMAQ